jgi:hypothetical protein
LEYGLVTYKSGLVQKTFSSVTIFLDIKCPHFCQVAKLISFFPRTTTFLYCTWYINNLIYLSNNQWEQIIYMWNKN